MRAGIHGHGHGHGWIDKLDKEVRGEEREERRETVGSRSNRRIWFRASLDSNLPVQWSGIAGFGIAECDEL